MSETAVNLLSVAALGALGVGLHYMGIHFALGFLAGCLLYHAAHRVKYGHWF